MAKVLFIEDNLSWQDILKELLETAGHHAYRASTLDLAIQLLGNQQEFDVIVFDLHLGTNAIGENPFVWLDALQDGLNARKLKIPQIIIVTGVDVTTQQVKTCFTQYRGIVFDFFEKTSFDPQTFMKSIKSATSNSFKNNSVTRSPWQVLGYTFLMTLIVVVVIGTLVISLRQIQDPKTQQTFLQIGGALIILFAVFVLIFSQNTKIEEIITSVTKLWRG